ncbi:hypothetical protein GCM10023100_09490 [Actinocorallia cavernae]|uniref:Antibiotic biosynthesis monooxygenase n=2 Tax=Actinomycetes TaxID=1760 RepID=A0ABP8SC70_9ACTN
MTTVTATIDTTRPVATLINVFTVAPNRQDELIALFARATEETMKHQPRFSCADFHASEDHYRAMLAHPEARVRMDQAAKFATDVQPRLFQVRSTHGTGRPRSHQQPCALRSGAGDDHRAAPVRQIRGRRTS